MKRFIILLITVLCTSISVFAQESNDNPANEGKQSVYWLSGKTGWAMYTKTVSMLRALRKSDWMKDSFR